MPAVREEWEQRVNSLATVVGRHSKEIDEYSESNGPMSREEVVKRDLTKLLSK